jgi:hypothetical protein
MNQSRIRLVSADSEMYQMTDTFVMVFWDHSDKLTPSGCKWCFSFEGNGYSYCWSPREVINHGAKVRKLHMSSWPWRIWGYHACHGWWYSNCVTCSREMDQDHQLDGGWGRKKKQLVPNQRWSPGRLRQILSSLGRTQGKAREAWHSPIVLFCHRPALAISR